MPQHRIPAFGGWESNAQSYTIVFDNVRADKGSIKINPNDPDFFSILKEQQAKPLQVDEVSDTKPVHLTEQQTVALPSPRPQPVSKRVNRRKDHLHPDAFPRSLNAELIDIGNEAGNLSQNDKNADEATDSFDSSSSAESAHNHEKNSMGERVHPAQMRLEMAEDDQLAVERPELDNGMKENQRDPQSPSHPLPYRGRLGNKAGVHGQSRSIPGQGTAPSTWSQRTRGNTRTEETQAVLPPFGAWDAKNSVSAEEYTAIFTNIREAKKAGISAGALPLHPEISERKTKEVREPAPHRRKASRWRMCCGAFDEHQ